jgi:hypothetical protein
MFLSISLDRLGDESAAQFKARAEAIEALAPDLVLLARDKSGVLAPPRVEALVDIAWMTGILRTPAVAAALPALHALPFHVARALSAADFLSAGRAAWLPLLGQAASFDAGYGTSLHDKDTAARADDFVRATRALWDSWDDDALVLDKVSGRYLDSTKVRRVDYRGAHHATMGSLNAARPPQGYPLLVRDLDDRPESAEHADILIGTDLPAAQPGVVRLQRVTDNLADALHVFREGGCEGLHLASPDAIDILRTLRASDPASAASSDTELTARARFALPQPVNRFTAKVPA